MRCFKDTNIPSLHHPPPLPPLPPCSLSLLPLPTTALMLLPPSVVMSPAQWSSSILTRDRETRESHFDRSGVWRSGWSSKENTHNRPGSHFCRGEAGQGRPGGGWACRVRDAVGARWVEPEPFSWRGEAGSWCLSDLEEDNKAVEHDKHRLHTGEWDVTSTAEVGSPFYFLFFSFSHAVLMRQPLFT